MRTLARNALFLLGGVIVAGLAILGLDIDEDDAASEGDCFERFEDDLRVEGARERVPKKDPGAVAAPAVVAPSVAEPEPMKRDVASSPAPQRVVTEPPVTAAEKTELPSAEKTEEVPSAEKTELPAVAPRPETLPPVRAPAVTFADDASDASDEPVTPDDVDASAADVWLAASAAAAATPHQAASSARALRVALHRARRGGSARSRRGAGGPHPRRERRGTARPFGSAANPRSEALPQDSRPDKLPDSDDDDAEAPSTRRARGVADGGRGAARVAGGSRSASG